MRSLRHGELTTHARRPGDPGALRGRRRRELPERRGGTTRALRMGLADDGRLSGAREAAPRSRRQPGTLPRHGQKRRLDRSWHRAVEVGRRDRARALRGGARPEAARGARRPARKRGRDRPPRRARASDRPARGPQAATTAPRRRRRPRALNGEHRRAPCSAPRREVALADPASSALLHPDDPRDAAPKGGLPHGRVVSRATFLPRLLRRQPDEVESGAAGRGVNACREPGRLQGTGRASR